MRFRRFGAALLQVRDAKARAIFRPSDRVAAANPFLQEASRCRFHLVARMAARVQRCSFRSDVGAALGIVRAPHDRSTIGADVGERYLPLTVLVCPSLDLDTITH